MLYFIAEKNPWASFGFIGEQLQTEDSSKNTKRFRVYKCVMENFFSPLNFTHYIKEESSMYLILNNLNLKDNPNVLSQIEKMIVEYYEIEGKKNEAGTPSKQNIDSQ